MTKEEKDALCASIKALITDWDTPYNNGRNEGIKAALHLVEVAPVQFDNVNLEHEKD